MYDLIHGGDWDRSDVSGFWETVLGERRADDAEDAYFARGFVEGALAVWDAVKDHV